MFAPLLSVPYKAGQPRPTVFIDPASRTASLVIPEPAGSSGEERACREKTENVYFFRFAGATVTCPLIDHIAFRNPCHGWVDLVGTESRWRHSPVPLHGTARRKRAVPLRVGAC